MPPKVPPCARTPLDARPFRTAVLYPIGMPRMGCALKSLRCSRLAPSGTNFCIWRQWVIADPQRARGRLKVTYRGQRTTYGCFAASFQLPGFQLRSRSRLPRGGPHGKQETGDWKARNRRLKTGNWRLETRNWVTQPAKPPAVICLETGCEPRSRCWRGVRRADA
jgi:hypothetical protein